MHSPFLFGGLFVLVLVISLTKKHTDIRLICSKINSADFRIACCF